MPRVPNPIRRTILGIGLALAGLGFVDSERARRSVDMAWPRIVTSLARTSKSAVDIAMVGIAVGPAAIAGVGFAGPYWSLAFTIGGGLAAGTIALVSQRYGAEAFDQLDQAVRSSLFLVVGLTLPIAAAFWAFSPDLIGLLTDDATAIEHGAAYLRIIALGVPFAAVNLVGGRILIGADDAWTPMALRASGAVVNVGINAVLIFGLGMGVVGAALGTVVSNAAVATAFIGGLIAGRVPGAGSFPVTVAFRGTYAERDTIRDIVAISTPVVGRNMVWSVARFPMLAFIALFGQHVVAAYVISRRVWGLMGSPGWGFALAASSLVGQSLGRNDEGTAELYGRDIVRIAVATYALVATVVFVFAEAIVDLFVADPSDPTIPVAVALVRIVCLAAIAQGVARPIAGALDATGDTRWPFYSRVLGMFGVALPLTYVGATTPLGLLGVYLSFFGMSVVPAVINYYRFSTGKWKAISREYRPEVVSGDD